MRVAAKERPAAGLAESRGWYPDLAVMLQAKKKKKKFIFPFVRLWVP